METGLDVKDLPQELLRELSAGARGNINATILHAMVQVDGPISLDRILVLVYKETGTVLKRNSLISKMHRFCQRGTVERCTNKGGVYRLVQR